MLNSTTEKGFEDIFRDTPYIDADIETKTAYFHLLYVPPIMRRAGHGKALFNQWLSELPSSVEQVVLKSCELGSGHTKPFWQSLGFTSAYCGYTDTDEGDATDILTLGVNGNKNTEPTPLKQGQTAHYIFGVE